jgi:hypothetical protein
MGQQGVYHKGGLTMVVTVARQRADEGTAVA